MYIHIFMAIFGMTLWLLGGTWLIDLGQSHQILAVSALGRLLVNFNPLSAVGVAIAELPPALKQLFKHS